MSYPELYSDERVLLQAQNVKVKSVSFEVVLTTRRLVLIDAKRGSIPPQEINLATLRDVEGGENAIRDPTITISIITISGNTRQMVLTFSKISGGERRRECDEWIRALRQSITTTVYHPVTAPPAPRDAQPAPVPTAPAPATPVAEPVQVPEPVPAPVTAAAPPPKKRIEVARPMKKIVEPAPVMPVPVETSSLPTGSFCNRCGNRVPPDSVFCNRCGTPVAQDLSPVLPEEEIVVPATVAHPVPPAVPQIQLTPPPAPADGDGKKERPIEEVIHSIEPLIEDSVPRTAPAPLVPAKQVHHTPPPAEEPAVQAPGSPPEATPESGATPGIQWPILTTSSSPVTPPAPESPATPEPVPPQAPPPAPKKSSFLATALLIIVVIAVLAGAYVFLTSGSVPPEPVVTPAPTVTPLVTVVTTIKTPVATPVVTTARVTTPVIVVPSSGVWVKVTYPNKYTGAIGTPGQLRDISDTGTHLYQVSTIDGPVVISVQKDDGSASELSVDVYKNGALVKHAQTVSPKGIIEMQTILKPDVTANTTV